MSYSNIKIDSSFAILKLITEVENIQSIESASRVRQAFSLGVGSWLRCFMSTTEKWKRWVKFDWLGDSVPKVTPRVRENKREDFVFCTILRSLLEPSTSILKIFGARVNNSSHPKSKYAEQGAPPQTPPFEIKSYLWDKRGDFVFAYFQIIWYMFSTSSLLDSRLQYLTLYFA